PHSVQRNRAREAHSSAEKASFSTERSVASTRPSASTMRPRTASTSRISARADSARARQRSRATTCTQPTRSQTARNARAVPASRRTSLRRKPTAPPHELVERARALEQGEERPRQERRPKRDGEADEEALEGEALAVDGHHAHDVERVREERRARDG